MNNQLPGLKGTASGVLVEVTTSIAARLAIHHLVRRSPAGGYSVLLWALIATGLSTRLTFVDGTGRPDAVLTG